MTPAATLGVFGVTAAVVVRAGLSSAGLAAIVVLVIVAGTSPFISHAVARSIVVRGGDAERRGVRRARDQAAADRRRQEERPR